MRSQRRPAFLQNMNNNTHKKTRSQVKQARNSSGAHSALWQEHAGHSPLELATLFEPAKGGPGSAERGGYVAVYTAKFDNCQRLIANEECSPVLVGNIMAFYLAVVLMLQLRTGAKKTTTRHLATISDCSPTTVRRYRKILIKVGMLARRQDGSYDLGPKHPILPLGKTLLPGDNAVILGAASVERWREIAKAQKLNSQRVWCDYYRAVLAYFGSEVRGYEASMPGCKSTLKLYLERASHIFSDIGKHVQAWKRSMPTYKPKKDDRITPPDEVSAYVGLIRQQIDPNSS